jgi:hypothetical protein
MTTTELITKLQEFPPGTPVLVDAYDCEYTPRVQSDSHFNHQSKCYELVARVLPGEAL